MQRDDRETSMITIIITIISVFLIVIGLIWLYGSVKEAIHTKGDIYRRWKTCQYVRARLNPYSIAIQILQQAFGAVHGSDRIRLEEAKIYAIPKNIPHKDILSEYGPPEPVYPPSVILFQTVVIGFLPQDWVVPVWIGVNLIAMFFLYLLYLVLLHRQSRFRERKILLYSIVGAALLIWPPTQITISHTQYSIVVLLMLLMAYNKMQSNNSVQAGLYFSLALIKPSLSLPFLIIPLVKRQWRILSVVFAIHIVSTEIFSLIVRSESWVVVSDWLRVAQYFTAGMYSLQEILNRLAWENTTIGNVMIGGFLAAVFFLCLYNRNANHDLLFDFLCFVSVIWTYHDSYDFIVLIIPLLHVLEDSVYHYSQSIKEGYRWIIALLLWLGCFVILGFALWTPIYRGDYIAFRLIRWGGRFALLVLFLRSGARLFPSSLRSVSLPLSVKGK